MAGGASYQVLPFSKENLVACFSRRSHKATLADLISKPQLQYLVKYCDSLDVRTIVHELEYVDRHFLEDYVGYYARCFENYGRFCSRLHLFGAPFTKRLLDNVISDPDSTKVSRLSPYFGFVVVKPLPDTVLGRTCLAVPNSHSAGLESRFPATIPCGCNLFGIDLQINSLVFQEQDHEVAACATSALWSVLSGTAHSFKHAVLSPFEITRVATAAAPVDSRALPNEGLDFFQMAGAVRHVGLEPFMLQAGTFMNAGVYAYLRGGIPALMGIDFNLSGKGERELHAVAINGYELSEGRTAGLDDLKLKADRLRLFYAHDDGVGPFVPLYLHGNDIIETGWSRNGEAVSAKMLAVLVPLYHKIRVPFVDIITGIRSINSIIEFLRKRRIAPLRGPLEWDVYVSKVDEFKGELSKEKKLSRSQMISLATKSWPLYVWRAIGRFENQKQIEWIFDATDLRQGRQIVGALEYDKDLGDTLRLFARNVEWSEVIMEKLTRSILRWYSER